MRIIFIYLLLVYTSLCVMATEYNNPQLTKYQKDIIGTWVYETGGETMYIVKNMKITLNIIVN